MDPDIPPPTDFALYSGINGRMVKIFFAALAAVPALWLPSVHAASPTADSVVGGTETGIASYYSRRFEGRRTASGDTFRHDALTAAHPHLPFGTIVRVTNTAKGHFVDVRITDRLSSRRTIIDLTRKAAAHLNMLQAGRVQVSVQVLESPGLTVRTGFNAWVLDVE